MAEYTNTTAQSIAVGSNALFSDTAVKACSCVTHRDGSGVFTLRGGHVYKLMFSGNVTGTAAGTAVALAIAIAGEALSSAQMISTPTVANVYNNVATFAEIVVPCNCCYNIAIENIGTTALTLQNANLIITRET